MSLQPRTAFQIPEETQRRTTGLRISSPGVANRPRRLAGWLG